MTKRGTERRNRFDVRTLLETSRLLIESRETDFILNNLLLITMGKLLVTRGAVLLYEPEEDAYFVSKIKGKARVQEGDKIDIAWKPDDSDDIVINPSKMNVDPPELFHNPRKGRYFNLKTGTHHLGYLYLTRKQDRKPFTKKEIEFVESLAMISSVAMANSRLFNEMRDIHRTLDRRIYELNTLFDLSKDLNVMADRDQIARTFKFTLLGQLLIRKFFLLFKIDGKVQLLTSSGLTRKFSPDERSRIFRLPDEEIYLTKDHSSAAVEILHENEISALVPLQVQGEKTAVVGVSEKANGESLEESDYNFLQSLGNLAVLSIQNSLFLRERIETERLEEELNLAKTIQKGLFPQKIPSIQSLDVAAKNIPSQQVGGDYYDIVKSPDTNYIFAIGDVTGKGFPAALLMANLQSMLHVLLPVEISLSEATGRINNLIFANTPSDKFITFFWGKYFRESRKFTYINAGHNPPLLLKQGATEFHELKEGGLILGAMPTISTYRETSIQIDPGDLLLFYTDGVTETFNRTNDEEFGLKRLQAIIKKHREKTPQQLIQAIIDEVNRFSDRRLSDDLTLIVIKAD